MNEKSEQVMGQLSHGSRVDVIARHARLLFHKYRLSWELISTDVVARYEQLPLEVRTIVFKHSRDAFSDVRANGKKLHKFFDETATVRLPVELEEAVVLTLEEKGADGLISELTARYGYIAAPTLKTLSDTGSVAGLATETGEAMVALGPMLADGKFGPEDRPHAEEALKQIQDVVAQALSLRHRIETEVLGRD